MCLSLRNYIKICSLYYHDVLIHNQPFTCNDIFNYSPFARTYMKLVPFYMQRYTTNPLLHVMIYN
jgi:hypothetical protein